MTTPSVARALVILLLVAPCASAEIIDRVLAVVSGQVVTQSDVEAAVELGLVSVAPGEDRTTTGLQSLIDRILMLNEVRRLVPPDPPESAVDARVAEIARRFPSAEALARLLRASGIDQDVLRVYAADDLRLKAHLDERFSTAAQPSDEDVRRAGNVPRETLVAERRRSLVADWLAELRRRGEVTYSPGIQKSQPR
jgi:hypothetical protein